MVSSQPSASQRLPLYFGHPDRPLFGWLHSPVEKPGANLALVICNPFGNEAISAHRSMRHLADAAADVGIPTLRFDYDGTGDSAGHDLDPDRVEAWVASIGLAADKLREMTGVAQVCLLGIRLGALLATLAARRRLDFLSLIAVAPVVSGRAYVRELRLLSRAIDSKRNVTRASGDTTLEAAGFVLTEQTQKTLGEIDLNRLEAAPAASILILDRTEMPSAEHWAQRLKSLGCRCERATVSGYPEMMLDAHESVPPGEVIRAALEWLRELAQRTPPQQVACNLPPPAPLRALVQVANYDDRVGVTPVPMSIEETAATFGTAPGLFGIVSTPASGGRETQGRGKAIILLNAGAVHHIGPNRLYVTLARHLARSGHTVLRVDIPGIGDSAPCDGEAENVVYSHRAVAAIEQALRHLQQAWASREVVAIGLCSGAYHAFKALAHARLPLSSAILINPLTFFWKEGMSLKYPEHRIAADMARYRTSTMRLSSWMKLLGGRVDFVELAHVLARHAKAVGRKPLLAIARLMRIPLRDDLPTELLSAVHTGAHLQFVFAANDPGRELLRNQGGGTVDRLRARGRLGIHLVEGADHTFTDLAARTDLVSFITDYLNRALAGAELEAHIDRPAEEPNPHAAV